MKRSAPVSGKARSGAAAGIIGLAAAVWVGGCATVLTMTPIGKEQVPGGMAGTDCTAEDRILSSWGEISGSLSVRTTRSDEFDSGVLQMGSPADVAALSNNLFLLDIGTRHVLFFDRGTQMVRRRLAIPDLGLRARIHVDRSLSLYVANPPTADVMQFDLDGRLMQRFANSAVLSDPIGISVSDADGRVFVADGLSARVVVFNALGAVEQVLGAEPASEFQPLSVRDVVTAPDQIYVSDEVARQIHYLSSSGRYRYSFGEDSLLAPGPIALDDANRVYAADHGDGTIKIYRGGELLSVFGGANNVDRVRFGKISGMWFSEGLLYVADPETVSIKILRAAEPCP